MNGPDAEGVQGEPVTGAPVGGVLDEDGSSAALGASDAYRMWAASYSITGRNALTRAVDQAVQRLLPDVRGLSVLDAGCGTGRWSERMTAAGGHVVAVDLVPEMLAELSDRSRAAVADVRALPFMSGRFDAALCVLVLGHLRDPAGALAEFSRVIAPGGWLLVADLHAAGHERGWRRTFRDDLGQLREVEWTPHSTDRLRADALKVDLRIQAHTEARLDASDLPDHLKSESGVTAAYALLARRW